MVVNRTLCALISVLGIAGSVWYVTSIQTAKIYADKAQADALYAATKQRFELFFAAHTFGPDANFIILSTPRCQNLHTVFKQCLQREQVKVLCDPLFIMAEQGAEGCDQPYRYTNVLTQLTPIDGGMRFTSLDSVHAGWWARSNDAPLVWEPQVGSYRRGAVPYRARGWYNFSLGKCYIHRLASADCLTDVSFFFNPAVVDAHTVFIAWNTLINRYEVVMCKPKEF